MEQRAVGRSGLRVSRLGLGTMGWGRTVEEPEARQLLDLFLSVGGNLIDTADAPGEGAEQVLLGRLLAEDSRREQVVLAVRTGLRPGGEPRVDCSRGYLLRNLDSSLRRLGVKTIDLWQLQGWDDRTPIEETMAAVDDAVQAGKVRYVGVSNFCGWQLARAAQLMLQQHPRASTVATQVEYSLLARGIEREVLPAAAAFGIGVLPWAPLGRGVLTGKYRSATPADSRAADPKLASFVAPFLDERCGHIVDAVCTAAEGLDVQPLEVALAWVRDQPGVTAPILGARKVAQLRAALESEQLTLPVAIRRALDDVSRPAMGYPERPDARW